MARMLANENVPGDVVTALRTDGHDVTWMRDVGPGSPDDRVLALAFSEYGKFGDLLGEVKAVTGGRDEEG